MVEVITTQQLRTILPVLESNDVSGARGNHALYSL